MSQQQPNFQTHGRIVTQNSDLLRLLRDKTEEALRHNKSNVGSVADLSNNSIQYDGKQNGRTSVPIIHSQTAPKTSKGGNNIQSNNVDVRGSGVFTVVNPVLLRAVGIKPTAQQETDFEHYAPKPLQVIDPSFLPGSQGQNRKQAFDVNNNSAKEIAYNNYLTDDPLPQNPSVNSNLESNNSSQNGYYVGTSHSSLQVGETPNLQVSTHSIFNSDEIEKPRGHNIQYNVTPLQYNSQNSSPVKDKSLKVNSEISSPVKSRASRFESPNSSPVKSRGTRSDSPNSSPVKSRGLISDIPNCSPVKSRGLILDSPNSSPVKSETSNTSLISQPVQSTSHIAPQVVQLNMSVGDQPINRVYIESPTFTKAEEEEYRFVSSRLDEFGENQETYREIVENTMPEPAPAKPKGNRRVHYEDSPPEPESSRYEDVNETEASSRSLTNASRQYVLCSSEPSRSSQNQSADLGPAPRQLPEKAPGFGHRLPTGPSYDPNDEDELEQEAKYQVNLITRIGEHTKRVSDLKIPKLPLPDSDDEFVQDSLDYEGETPQYNPNFVKDSLELYNGGGGGADGEWEAPHQAYHPAQHYVQSPNKLLGGQPIHQHAHHPGYQEEVYHQQVYPQPYAKQSSSNQQQYENQPVQNQRRVDSKHQGHSNYQEEYDDGQGHQRYEDYNNYGEYGQSEEPYYQQQQQQQIQYQPVPHGQPIQQPRYPGPSPQYSDSYLAQGEPYPQQVQPVPQPRNFVRQTRPTQPHITYSQQQGPQHASSGSSAQNRDIYRDDRKVGEFFERHPHAEPPPQRPENYQRTNPNQQEQSSYPNPVTQGPPQGPPQGGPYLQPPPRLAYTQQTAYSQQRDPYEQYEDQSYDNQSYGVPPFPEPQHDYYVEDYAEGETPSDSPQKSASGESSTEKARLDFIEKNRKDYGRVPKKSYKQIQAIKKEEGAKLENIFISPKVKPKKKQPSSAPVSNQKSSAHYMSSPQLNQKPATAEELWAQKASHLSTQKDPKKKAKLTKYPSDGGLPVINQRPENGVSANNSRPFMNHPSRNPANYQQLQQPLTLEPISRELITEDGQRISVDVNLKLLSPQSGSNNNWYSEQNAWEDYSSLPSRQRVGVPYDINSGIPQQPVQQKSLDYTDYEDYPETRAYPSSRNYESAPEYLDSSQPTDIQGGRPSTNPYHVIPPIQKSNENSPSIAIDPDDSYVVQYRKQKEKKTEEPWYKIYNLKDYRKMQKEVRLGSLGPDLDSSSHKERIEKFQRQSDYARMVNERNKKQAASSTVSRRPPSYPRKEQDDIMNKRRMAVEYSKTIPKPQVKPHPSGYNSYQVSGQIPFGKKLVESPRKDPNEMDVIDLENLRIRHERDKQNVAMIQQNLETQKV
ncbi:uncharacterized protein LOC126829887 [Patella vulgata]|uniref:uncharacterized protein LOC126829887 n=1 Tax=Patella vulgata TaxID=6465 RepID=UPI0021805705|nr:uncharacterized protein LOC126829887 [Patella vulgata]